jgi:hypothetical protein
MINRIYIPGKVLIKLDGTRHFKPDDSELAQSYLKEFMSGEVEVEAELTLNKVKARKTNPQLRYFYGVVIPLIKAGLEELQGETYTKAEVIMFLKDKFFYEEIEMNGEFIKLPMSLAKGQRKEVSKFISDVINFGNDFLSLQIPQAQ